MEKIEQMRSMRAQGYSLRKIADILGVSHQKVFFDLGGQRTSRLHSPANDNKIVKMMPHNGGCSTVSGEMPVSLRRIPTLDAAEVEPSDRELLLAGLVADEMQVAA
jgi:hypothetical protein